jgi:hypothetical protein
MNVLSLTQSLQITCKLAQKTYSFNSTTYNPSKLSGVLTLLKNLTSKVPSIPRLGTAARVPISRFSGNPGFIQSYLAA